MFNTPHGRAEDWAFEELKTKMKDLGDLENDQGKQAFDDFKAKLTTALSLSDDVLLMELEDYIA